MGRGGSRRSNGRVVAALLAMSGLSLVRCDEAPTRIVLVLEVEPTVASRMEAVDVSLVRENAAPPRDAGHFPLVGERRVSLVSPDRDGLLVFVPRDLADPRRLFVTVVGSLQGGATIRQTALTRFVRGQTLYLHIALVPSCVAVQCREGSTCLDGTCRPINELTLSTEPPARTQWDAATDSDVPPPQDATGHDDLLPADAAAADVPEASEDRGDPIDAPAPSEDVTPFDAPSDVPPMDAPTLDADALQDTPTVDVDALLAELPDDAVGDAGADGPELPPVDVTAEPPPDAGVDRPDDDRPSVDVHDVTLDTTREPDASDASSDAPPDAPLARCTPGTLLTGLRPTPLTPWSASYAGSSTPTLRWRGRPGERPLPVCIEICRDRACSAVEQVIRHPGGGPVDGAGAVLVPTPLEAGVHYWRITAEDVAFSPPQWSPFGPTWEFFVTRNAPARAYGETPVWGCVSDFNGDGLADVVVPTAEARGGVQIYQSVRSSGVRGVTPIVVEDVNSQKLSVGDVNGDGFVDLVTVGYASPETGVFPGGPTGLGLPVPYGGFLSGATCAGGGSACDCRTIGDVDDDGAADVFCAVFDVRMGTTTVGRQRIVFGADLFGEPASSRLLGPFADTGTSAGPFGGLLDANRDGVADLLIAGGRPRQIEVIRGEPGWPGRVQHTFSAAVEPTRLVPGGDMNGDGYADLVLDLVGTGAGGAVHFGPLTATAPRSVAYAANNHAQMFPAPFDTPVDLDGDGLTDLLRGDSNYSSVVTNGGRVVVLLGQRDAMDGTPALRSLPPTVPLTGGRMTVGFRLGWMVVPLGDSDGDGFGDFYAGAAGGPEVLFYRGVTNIAGDLEAPYSVRWPLRL